MKAKNERTNKNDQVNKSKSKIKSLLQKEKMDPKTASEEIDSSKKTVGYF